MNYDVSIIICTYNRSASLNNTLNSLLKIHQPKNCLYNILVIDNNSSDDTKSVVESIKEISPVKIVYIFEKKQGLSNARNRGVAEAEGNILCFIDDDVKVKEDWLIEVMKAFEIHDPACASGKALLPKSLNKPNWWSESYNGVLGEFDIGNDLRLKDDKIEGIIGIGANMSFKRKIFMNYGFFRSDLGRQGSKLIMGEETELVERLVKNGEKVIYYPGAVVYHCTDISRITKSYLRRHYYRIGEWGFVESRLKESNHQIGKWMIRSIVDNYFKSKILLFKGREKESFFHELQALQIFGYVSCAVKWHFGHKCDY